MKRKKQPGSSKPIAQSEGDTNLTDWWWVAPGAEQPLKDAIRAALSPKR